MPQQKNPPLSWKDVHLCKPEGEPRWYVVGGDGNLIMEDDPCKLCERMNARCSYDDNRGGCLVLS